MEGINPTSRERLEELAAQGNEDAFRILESLKGTEEDPFCHASGKRCPAVDFCVISQMAKRQHELGEIHEQSSPLDDEIVVIEFLSFGPSPEEVAAIENEIKRRKRRSKLFLFLFYVSMLILIGTIISIFTN